MKTLRVLFGVVALVALLGLNVVLADIKNDSAAVPQFPLDAGDGSNLSPISFDNESDNGAQTTCATTPGGGAPNPMMELNTPVDPLRDTEQLTQYDDLSPVSGQDPQNGAIPSRDLPPRQPGWQIPPNAVTTGDDATTTSSTPEPATMLIIGLGIGGVAVAARRRLNKGNR